MLSVASREFVINFFSIQDSEICVIGFMEIGKYMFWDVVVNL